jgi:hypothetical protein
VGSNPGTIYWMDASDATKITKIKVAELPIKNISINDKRVIAPYCDHA